MAVISGSWSQGTGDHRRAARVALKGMLAGVAVMLLVGCAHYTPAKNMALLAREAPVPRWVPRGKQFAMAEAHAEQHANSFVLFGSGRSMEPMYPSNTAVVVHECSFRTLKTGMPVVYRNRRGFYVAHMLVDDLPGGWLAIGVNNTEPDDDLVTADNFVGVITAAFAPATNTNNSDVASSPAPSFRPGT